jgi:signal transduction histidine kinase
MTRRGSLQAFTLLLTVTTAVAALAWAFWLADRHADHALHAGLLRAAWVAAPAGLIAAALVLADALGELRTLGRRLEALRSEETIGAPISIRSVDALGQLAAECEHARRRFEKEIKRQAQERAQTERTDRSQRNLLDALRHELRTPLHVVLGFTEVLMQEIDGPLMRGQREDLETIADAGRHLVRLFDDLLDLSTAPSTDVHLELEDVDVIELVRAIDDELRGQEARRRVALRIDCANDVVLLRVDRTRVRRILTNLLANALKFTERGEVTVVVLMRDVDVRIEIHDGGPGFGEVAVDTLFDDFTQEGGEARKLRGAGLGLAIVRQLTEMHGGRIEIVPRPGHGGCVAVELPLRSGG